MMNNKWLVSIVAVSLLLNIIVVSIGLREIVAGQSSLITVPPITKGQGYVLTIPNESMTCISLEQKLGLQRGDVISISNSSETGMVIVFKKDVALTSTQVQTATDAIKGLVPDIVTK